MMKRMVFVLLSLILFSSCGGEAPTSPFQNWEELSFRLETRPMYMEKGMMEFLVIANRPGRKPAYDLLIELRMGPTGPWVQAIEDGRVGVYRRAVRVTDPKTDILYVHILRDGKEGLLEFPLAWGIKP